MKLLGDAVVFRSDDEWYEVEESGSKNATVRLLSRRDWRALVSANPPLIIIRHAGDDTAVSFVRRLTGWYICGELLGSMLVLFCWDPEAPA